MVRANHLSEGYVLHSPLTESYVVYQEDVSTINLDMTVTGEVPVKAVNTKKSYQEIHLGLFGTGNQTFKLPDQSDWVIAVGHFVSR